MTFNIGLVVNPLAGLGGSVALKGSDNVAEEAIALGAEPKANVRCLQALSEVIGLDVCVCICGQYGCRLRPSSRYKNPGGRPC